MDEMERKTQRLKEILADSRYTVAVGGSGMLSEGGYSGLKTPEKAYKIEQRYGLSPEEIFTAVFYNNRPEQFFEFYREEILKEPPRITESSYALEKLEAEGRIQCVIDSNIFEMFQRGGCRNVIPLHGSIYKNRCPHCGRSYSMEYIRDSRRIPKCEDCRQTLRPGVVFYGEMMDSRLMSAATREIERAEVLLLLGTHIGSEVYSKYLRYFGGEKLVIIHKNRHYLDEQADLVLLEEPRNILKRLVG